MLRLKRKYMMDKLLLDIKQKREEMIQSGLQHGLTSAETIAMSQELDTLIVRYQQYKAAADIPLHLSVCMKPPFPRRLKRSFTKAVIAAVAASMIG